MNDGKSTRYSIIGLGKLGASMAAAIASRGYQVIGVDVSKHAVDAVNAGRAPVYETNLEALIRQNKDRLHATMSHMEAVQSSDISFVIVPTPSDDRGAFSLQYAAWAFREIGSALAKKTAYHLVVLTSTVLPGSTQYALLPILEKYSGKQGGKDFGLAYSPEFIALGSVIHDFLNPDFTLVGELDDRSGRTLEDAYAQIMNGPPPCKRMTLENAELTKIAVNTFVTTKMTFANMLVDICERLPGGDVDVVTNALGCDKRIGSRYLKGAIGYGGPCFPRDNVALSFFARQVGSSAELAETTDKTNRGLAEKTLEQFRPLIPRGATVAVLGLSYKPHSHVVEESQGIRLAKALANAGARVVTHDPLAREGAMAELHDHALVLDTVEACLEQADFVFVTTPDPAYQRLTASEFKGGKQSVTVVDFWRILCEELEGKAGIRYIPIGRGREDEANAARLTAMWNADLRDN